MDSQTPVDDESQSKILVEMTKQRQKTDDSISGEVSDVFHDCQNDEEQHDELTDVDLPIGMVRNAKGEIVVPI